ncbi:uncharacterized protein LOC133293306 [Gastrolobium bilobum]|uniref:uncharacterized protein LOC133293306 n=1 Tax=Gastrolobium bilobum TaxID=150636 RepID=UPI002AB266D2|nr:uncharacterized protein LOC133293306 [Gastrolobium bilobum]
MYSKYDFIKDLNPTKEEWKIKARVVRTWKVPNFQQKKFDDNVEMILLDEKGGRIHAAIKGSLHIRKKIHEGEVYFIKIFGVGSNTGSFRPTKHDYRLSFNLRTDVKSTIDSAIPTNGFDFVDFDVIEKEFSDSPYLVDVIGLVSGIGEVREHIISGRKTRMVVVELDNLSSINSEDMLDPDIVLSLKEMLDKHNSIAQSFRYARDRYRDNDFTGVKLRLIRKRGSDGRVYNLSSASEVAALIVGDIDSALGDRDIVVETQDIVLQRIDVKHPLYLGLQYPLLFPYSEDGYRDDVERSYTSHGRTNPRSTSDRLNFIRYNQSHLRAELYKNIKNAFDRGEDEAINTGKRIIIHSSFTGGPRYMAENCKDAFAICRWAGYPHLFITITCNPKWPEITRFLKARKLNAEDDVCTVEFQKRGLPHAHILLFLHPSEKPNTGLDIDNLISAEIPNKDSNPSLFAAVTSYMMHEPCGPDNYKSPCMKNGHCSKKFPKKFCSRTFIDDDGFPHYRRRNDGSVVKKNGVELDNRYVVPYNAKLLLKYQTHINVEYTCQSSAIKYLFKYIHKGKDKVTAAINHSDDEIKMFYDCSDHASITNVKTKAESRQSMFESWMDANKKYPEGRNLTYAEYPTQFVYKESMHEWHPRKQGFSIGRINHFSANNGEDSYLRTLLNFQKGCASYEDLRTVNGVLFPTYKDACYSLGLLDDDNEYIDAIKEASSWGSATYLRNLFALLLFGNSMNKPENVFQKCWELLSNDVLYRHRQRIGREDALLTEDSIKTHNPCRNR